MNFDEVTFVDVEADRSGQLLSIGVVRGHSAEHLAPDGNAGGTLASLAGSGVVAGHNLLGFDLPLLAEPPVSWPVPRERVLDTLVLSMLAEPTRVSHALDKPEPSRGALPDPVADARRARDRALACISALSDLEPAEARLYAALLERAGHHILARLLAPERRPSPLEAARELPEAVLGRLCRIHLFDLLRERDLADQAEYVSLALAVRFIQVHSVDGRLASPPGALILRSPRFNELLSRLLGPLCPDLSCPHRHDCEVHRPFAEEILQSHFELPSFRPHQKQIVLAVLGGQNPLVVLPTGGGKSLCYQLPAVHGAERLKGLTVVISPLQALMADQVRALSERYPPTCALNATLLMEERRQNLSGLRSGRYNVLYMGPEQLRNPSVRRLLQSRPPFLWVIDEAHCISRWGHSFRTDYTYLPRAIAELHQTTRPPLVALFTATATTEVREDIAEQLQRGLGIGLTPMDHGGPRENLRYEVRVVADGQAKRNELLNLLEAMPEGSRLVYCATVREARDVHEMLREQGVDTALYHGRLDPNEKAEQLDSFMRGRARTVVATSAFGMGIDKPDIRLVVHYEPSGSLEDYVQETGRAGRDGEPARCVLLFHEADLETQFYLKTMSRITAREVRRVWRAIRARAARMRASRDAEGWVDLWVSPEDLFVEEQLEHELSWSREVLQSKLKLVLYHLEADGVCKRQENRTRPWGLYPLKSYTEAVASLPVPTSPATRRVLEYLYSPERPRQVSILDVGDECGLKPGEAFREVQTLTTRGLIGQELSFDVTLARGVPRSTDELARQRFECAAALLDLVQDPDEPCVVHLRSAAAGVGRSLSRRVPPFEVFQVLRALRNQGLIRMDRHGPGRFRVRFEPDFLRVRDRVKNLQRVAEAVRVYLDGRLSGRRGRDISCAFDVQRFVDSERRLTETFQPAEVIDACLTLHHLGAWHLSDPPVLLETAFRVRVKHDAPASALDMKRPARYHQHQVALVHMMREYAVLDPQARAHFVRAYFELPRSAVLDAYFQGRKKRLTRPVSPATEASLLEGLTDAQRLAVTAEDSALLVVAGPGSGKTHTIVRRVSHMVRARQVRPEEILVLAFNRAAVVELGTRLFDQLGDRGRRIEVRTFHSLALKLTGADLGSEQRDAEERLSGVIAEAAALLQGDPECDELEHGALREHAIGHVKHVLVDEYQDLDADQYRLLAALVGLDRTARERIERSVYVVGDDDQAIYGFRKAQVAFLRRFEQEFGARRVCLSDNFRSNAVLVTATRAYIARNEGRMKTAESEQMRAAPGAASGDADSLRVFRYPGVEQVTAHAFYVVQRSLEQGIGSLGVLARNWSDLDALRAQLESAGVPFVLHHRDHHRPVHRRHPVERLLRALWKHRQPIDGPATEWLAQQLAEMGRDASEACVKEVLAFAEELDEGRRLGPERLLGIDSYELADSLLIASRDAALRGGSCRGDAAVHLSTFHGAKGLEFDKTVLFPSRPAESADAEEERRLYYVALTRARHQVIACTLGARAELAAQLERAAEDLGPSVGKLPAPRTACFDCDPSHVQLINSRLLRAQGRISRLREGDELTVRVGNKGVELSHGGETVSLLSRAGKQRFDTLKRPNRTATARVHEIYVHLERRPDGTVHRRTLVVVPAVRFVD